MQAQKNRGIVVIAVNLAESVSTIQPYAEQYPEILFLRDQYEFVWDVYKVSGKLPLIYILDHDVDQSVRMVSEEFSIGQVVSTTMNLLSPVSARLDPETVSVKAGSDLMYNFKIKNWTGETEVVWVKIDMMKSDGGVVSIYPMQRYTMPPYQLRDIDMVNDIPIGIPAGFYRWRALIGVPGELLFMDWFEFEVLR